MGKSALKLAVYPLLLVNIALGYVMLIMSYQMILVIVDALNRGGLFTGDAFGPVSYIRSASSSFGIILLALAALILFPLLESYYSKVAGDGRKLLTRFVRVIGIQFVYIGVFMLAFRLLVTGGLAVDAGLLLVAMLLVAGAVMLVATRTSAVSKRRQNSQNSA